VPADSWYEWVLEAGGKQPYCIRRVDAAPLYFRGLTRVGPDAQPREGDAFVIATTAAEEGLTEVQHRIRGTPFQPVCLLTPTGN
jgi:putative SOS response-associated peptidase YedK